MLDSISIWRVRNRVISLEAGYKRREEILHSFNEAVTSLADLRHVSNPTPSQRDRIKMYEKSAADRKTHMSYLRRTYENLQSAREQLAILAG